jgi:hypothetical protein
MNPAVPAVVPADPMTSMLAAVVSAKWRPARSPALGLVLRSIAWFLLIIYLFSSRRERRLLNPDTTSPMILRRPI